MPLTIIRSLFRSCVRPAKKAVTVTHEDEDQGEAAESLPAASTIADFVHGAATLDVKRLLEHTGLRCSLPELNSSQLRQALTDEKVEIKEIILSNLHSMYIERYGAFLQVIGELPELRTLKLEDISLSTQCQAVIILSCGAKNNITTIKMKCLGPLPYFQNSFLQALERRPQSLQTATIDWLSHEHAPPEQCKRLTHVLSTFQHVAVEGIAEACSLWPGFLEGSLQSTTLKSFKVKHIQLPQQTTTSLMMMNETSAAAAVAILPLSSTKSCSALEHLELIDVDLDEARFVDLARAIETSSPTLRSFAFSPYRISRRSFGWRAFAAFERILARNTTLEYIRMDYTWTTTSLSNHQHQSFSDLKEEVGAGWHPHKQNSTNNLVELDLMGNYCAGTELGHMVAEKLRHVGNKLRRVNLSGCDMGDDAIRDIAAALESNVSTTIEEVDLRGNDIGHAAMTAFSAALKKNTFLKICRLGFVLLNDATIQAVTEFLKVNTTLEKFRLHLVSASDEPLQLPEHALGGLIDALKGNFTVTVLDFGRTLELGKWQERIQLYTSLNAKVDRAALMSQEATVEDWIDSLVQTNDNLDYIFLLLRLNPFVCLRATTTTTTTSSETV